MSQDGYILVREVEAGHFSVNHMDASCEESREFIGIFSNLKDAMDAANTFEDKEAAEGYPVEYGIEYRPITREDSLGSL